MAADNTAEALGIEAIPSRILVADWSETAESIRIDIRRQGAQTAGERISEPGEGAFLSAITPPGRSAEPANALDQIR